MPVHSNVKPLLMSRAWAKHDIEKPLPTLHFAKQSSPRRCVSVHGTLWTKIKYPTTLCKRCVFHAHLFRRASR